MYNCDTLYVKYNATTQEMSVKISGIYFFIRGVCKVSTKSKQKRRVFS